MHVWCAQGGADYKYEQRPSVGSRGVWKVALIAGMNTVRALVHVASEGMQDSIDLLILL